MNTISTNDIETFYCLLEQSIANHRGLSDQEVFVCKFTAPWFRMLRSPLMGRSPIDFE